MIRRGPGSADTKVGSGYAGGVHQDYGMGPQAYRDTIGSYAEQEDVDTWSSKYADDATKGFQVVCFWRPVEMSEPLNHKPLAVCDPQSVRREDCI